jgi:hypothetical protein
MNNGIQYPAFNFDGNITPYAITGNTENPGEPSLTELAKSFQPIVAQTSLSEIFPDENIGERHVYIQQEMSTVDTIFPLVRFGQPDVILGQNYGTTRAFTASPLYIRRSSAVSYGEINSKIKPGTANDKWSPEEQISKVVEGMVREHNLTWDVWRASMLLGGINYTDPRSGVGASVNAQIPVRNFFKYNVTSGYRGRPEAQLFRTLSDFNDTGVATAGVPWTHPDADIVNSVARLLRWFKETNKGIITRMYMHAELKEILMMANQVRLVTGGLLGVPGKNDTRIIPNQEIVDREQLGLSGYTLGLSAEGLTAIAGIPIYTVETSYKDPVDGINKRVWPKNKVVFVADKTTNGESVQIGRTQFCVSEESGGAPGLWTRQQNETQIPAAPGMHIQMGNAGMPYLRYPYMVAHMTVCEVEDINNRLGVLGDMHFGMF